MEKNDSLKMKIAFLLGLFCISSVYGFIYETLFYYLNDGMWLRRGTCFGPFIQIYGWGGLLIYLVCRNMQKHPIRVTLLSGGMCGLLEYIVGWLIYETMDGLRPWDYNTEIWNWGNINGFVCFRSVAVFALSGIMLIYVVVPLLKWLRNKIGDKAFFWIMMIPGAICMIDTFYNDIICKFFPFENAMTFWDKRGWPNVNPNKK